MVETAEIGAWNLGLSVKEHKRKERVLIDHDDVLKHQMKQILVETESEKEADQVVAVLDQLEDEYDEILCDPNFMKQKRLKERNKKFDQEVLSNFEKQAHAIEVRKRECRKTLVSLFHHLPEISRHLPELNKLSCLGMIQICSVTEDFEKLRDLDGEAVQLVQSRENEQKFVIKECGRHDKSEMIRLLAKTADTLSKLCHPSVLELKAVLRDETLDAWYLQFPFISGGSLQDWLNVAGYNNQDQRLMRKKRTILRKILLGLAYIHSKRIIHRDLKPQNIFLTSDGDPVIGDFDAAYDEQRGLKTLLTTRQKGGFTRVYCAPEIDSPTIPSSPALDMYSFGVVCYQMYTGILYEKYRGVELDKIPELLSPHLDVNYKEHKECLLHEHPKFRPSAQELLCSPFFSTEEEEEKSEQRRNSDILMMNLLYIKKKISDLRSKREEDVTADLRIKRNSDGTMDKDGVRALLATLNDVEWLGHWVVTFEGESGIDGGGLRKEFINGCFEALAFAPPDALFVCEGDDSDNYIVSAQANESNLETCGKLLTRALLYDDLIDSASKVGDIMWKFLLDPDCEVTMADFKTCQPLSSYLQLQRYRVFTDEDFAAHWLNFALLEGCESEAVTTRNRERFIKARMQSSLIDCRKSKWLVWRTSSE